MSDGSDGNDEVRGQRLEHAANLFDLRRIIGGLFVARGVLLTILGLFESQQAITKAAGVNINLYAGLGMLTVGLLFLLWAFSRPLGEELREAEAGESESAAPAGVDGDGASEESRGLVRGDRERAVGPSDARR